MMKQNRERGIIIYDQIMSYSGSNSTLYNYDKLNSTLKLLEWNRKFNKLIHKMYKNDSQRLHHKSHTYFPKFRIWKKNAKLAG